MYLASLSNSVKEVPDGVLGLTLSYVMQSTDSPIASKTCLRGLDPPTFAPVAVQMQQVNDSKGPGLG